MTSLRDDLKAARLLIATPDTWCRGQAMISGDDGQPYRYCALGAAMIVAEMDTDIFTDRLRNTPRYDAMRNALHRAVNAIYNNSVLGVDVVEVNDFKGHQAVLDMYDRAIALADGDDAA